MAELDMAGLAVPRPGTRTGNARPPDIQDRPPLDDAQHHDLGRSLVDCWRTPSKADAGDLLGSPYGIGPSEGVHQLVGRAIEAVARVWRDLIRETFDAVEPSCQRKISALATGLAEIAAELAGTSFGIIVVTPGESVLTWLNYEAGALSKDLHDDRAALHRH